MKYTGIAVEIISNYEWDKIREKNIRPSLLPAKIASYRARLRNVRSQFAGKIEALPNVSSAPPPRRMALQNPAWEIYGLMRTLNYARS